MYIRQTQHIYGLKISRSMYVNLRVRHLLFERKRYILLNKAKIRDTRLDYREGLSSSDFFILIADVRLNRLWISNFSKVLAEPS